MEYEIGDDPQGLPDRPDGGRNGGLSDDRMFIRTSAPAKRPNSREDDRDAHLPLKQFGEAA